MLLKNNRGFTLLELIMALAIASILMTVLFSFLMFNINVYHRTDEEMRLKSSLDDAMTRITKIAKGAYDVSDNGIGGISFINEDGAISDIVTFEGAENKLTISYETGSSVVFNDITEFRLTGSDGLIDIAIHGSSERADKTVSTTVQLRNYIS